MSNEVSKNNFQWLINISFIGISVFLAYIMVLESPPPLCFTVKNIIAVFPPTFLIPRVWHDKGRELKMLRQLKQLPQMCRCSYLSHPCQY